MILLAVGAGFFAGWKVRAARLAAPQPKREPRMLAATTDHVSAFSARAERLRVLLEQAPHSEEAKEARAEALAGSDPHLLLVVALDSGEAGPPLLAALAELETAPDSVRAQAVVALAKLDPTAYVKCFLRLLRSPFPLVQRAAIEAIGMLDFADIPHHELLAGRGAFSADGKRAAMAIWSRVIAEGGALDPEMRGRVYGALREDRKRDGSLAGALALAPVTDTSGALSIPRREEQGALSVSKKDPDQPE